MKYEDGAMSLYQTISVTPNGLRPSKGTREGIVANIIGSVEKYDNGTNG